jgi:hypothetical protein
VTSIAEDPKKTLSHILWPDADLETIRIDFNTIQIAVTAQKKRHFLECRGYIGYQVVGFWDEAIIEWADISYDDDFLTACIASIEKQKADSGSEYRNRRDFFCLSIGLIDGNILKFVQNGITFAD